jgi:hypothetical protein
MGEDPYIVATLLLNTLLERRKEEVDKSFEGWIRRLTPSYANHRQRQSIRIEALIEQLQQLGQMSTNPKRNFATQSILGAGANVLRPHTYDLTESLLASGFFCTMYWYTPNMDNAPEPLWEQLSLKSDNVKGQQYYERNDFQEAVINYSEIWGRTVYITAEGTFQPMSSSSPSSSIATTSAPVKNNRRLRTCPDLFQVDATKVTLHAFGGFLSLDLPIQGSSNLVILYADPRLRIFISPMESKSAVGHWEEAGLVVVQVRSDLVLGLPVIDLR